MSTPTRAKDAAAGPSSSTGTGASKGGRYAKPPQIDLQTEPSFAEYVAARKVILYEFEQLRRGKYRGQLSIARDEMVAQVILKSCPRYRADQDIAAEILQSLNGKETNEP